MRVDIVLATYNGAEYIEEQVNSIIEQDHTNWRLIVSDDGSTDDTVDMIKSLATKRQCSDRVKFVDRCQVFQGKGPTSNFLNGLYFSDSEYTMFCDQDDVWFKNKVSQQLKSIMSLNQNLPAVSFCDSTVVDSDLTEIDNSFRHHENLFIDSSSIDTNSLMFQNYAPGCCMILNKKLRELIFSYEINVNSIVMHDWYIMLIASITGNIMVCREPLMYYRQHSSNQVGVSSKLKIRNFKSKYIRSKFNHERSKEQLVYIDSLPFIDDKVLRELVNSFKGTKTDRWKTIFKNNIRKSNGIKTLWLYLQI